MNNATLQPLYTEDGYRRSFMDADLWRPFVETICLRHQLQPPRPVRPTLPGTYPTFVVAGRWVVKLFGPLFDGAESFAVEKEVNDLVSRSGAVPAPRLLGWGELFPAGNDWTWPYLIFTYLPGVSLGEIIEQVPFTEKLALARELGRLLRRLHALPLPARFHPAGERYAYFLQQQHARALSNHRRWGLLSDTLLGQLAEFLRPASELLPANRPVHLIHADLTRDHLIGRLDSDRWTTLGLIDFGDAMAGDLYYELVALHLDLFGGDKRLLSAFLTAYGPAGFSPSQAMKMTLLHRFNVLEGVRLYRPELLSLPNFTAMTTHLWDPDAVSPLIGW